MANEIRWKQRFSNFEMAFLQLQEAVGRRELDRLAQAGLIKIFELTFELAWKTLKDRLEYDGFEADSPREVIKIAFQNKYLSDGAVWLDALDKRNLLTHTYDEQKSAEARKLICGPYYRILQDLYNLLIKDR